MNGGATVYVIDGDTDSRRAIQAVTDSMGLEVELFWEPEPFLKECFGQCVGCLLTDLPAVPGYFPEILDRMVDCQITLPTIVATPQPQTDLIVQLMKQGAITVLEKPFCQQSLRDGICEALKISDAMRSERIQRQIFLGRIASLTQNERRVMDLVVVGLANKVIARRLHVSVRTVESWRHKVFAKMQCKSVAELVRTVVCYSSSEPRNAGTTGSLAPTTARPPER